MAPCSAALHWLWETCPGLSTASPSSSTSSSSSHPRESTEVPQSSGLTAEGITAMVQGSPAQWDCGALSWAGEPVGGWCYLVPCSGALGRSGTPQIPVLPVSYPKGRASDGQEAVPTLPAEPAWFTWALAVNVLILAQSICPQ